MRGSIPWQDGPRDWPFRLPELVIDPVKTGLLIVDMSNHFARQAGGVLPNNVRLLDFFRARSIPVLYCLVGSLLPDARDQHPKRRLTWLRASAADPPTLCPRGAFDYEVMEALQPLPGELVLDKNSQGAFNSSAIDHYLRSMGIETLVISGVATSHCVESTARDAADHGYNVILVSDACADRDREKHRVTLETFARFFGTVKTTDEVIAGLGRLLKRRGASE